MAKDRFNPNSQETGSSIRPENALQARYAPKGTSRTQTTSRGSARIGSSAPRHPQKLRG